MATAVTRQGGCADLFNRTVSGGWGVSEFPTLADYPEWRYENCSPGDDWYRDGDPEYFRVEDGIAIIETTPAFINSDPWMWMYPRGNPSTFQFPFEMEVRFRVDSTVTGNQIDFYIGDSEAVGDIGSVGNVWYITFDFNGPSGDRHPNLRTFGFGGVLQPGTNYFESDDGVPLTTDLWGNWLTLRWMVDPFVTHTVRGKIWREDLPEPDWQCGFDLVGAGSWGGLRQLIVGAYHPSGGSGTTKWSIDHIKDLNGSICAMLGSDFPVRCNGAIVE
jgi:hypothetical protein